MNERVRKVDWDTLTDQPYMAALTEDFALGYVSARTLYAQAQVKGLGGEVRNLIRPGVMRARRLARKALRRRDMLVA